MGYCASSDGLFPGGFLFTRHPTAAGPAAGGIGARRARPGLSPHAEFLGAAA